MLRSSGTWLSLKAAEGLKHISFVAPLYQHLPPPTNIYQHLPTNASNLHWTCCEDGRSLGTKRAPAHIDAFWDEAIWLIVSRCFKMSKGNLADLAAFSTCWKQQPKFPIFHGLFVLGLLGWDDGIGQGEDVCWNNSDGVNFQDPTKGGPTGTHRDQVQWVLWFYRRSDKIATGQHWAAGARGTVFRWNVEHQWLTLELVIRFLSSIDFEYVSCVWICLNMFE